MCNMVPQLLAPVPASDSDLVGPSPDVSGYRRRCPPRMDSNSQESLNRAQCASVLELDSTGITTGGGNTHDLRAAIRRPFSERKFTVVKYIPKGGSS